MNLERWGCLYIYIETVREWRCIKDNVKVYGMKCYEFIGVQQW